MAQTSILVEIRHGGRGRLGTADFSAQGSRPVSRRAMADVGAPAVRQADGKAAWAVGSEETFGTDGSICGLTLSLRENDSIESPLGT